MVTDLGLSARVRVWTDSNAAKAIASKRSESVKMKQVPGEQNLADHLTEGMSWCEIDE